MRRTRAGSYFIGSYCITPYRNRSAYSSYETEPYDLSRALESYDGSLERAREEGRAPAFSNPNLQGTFAVCRIPRPDYIDKETWNSMSLLMREYVTRDVEHACFEVCDG